MMCGLFPRLIAWAIMSMPPTRTAHLTPIPTPNASNCSAICNASSLVGDSTRAKFACGVSRSSWSSTPSITQYSRRTFLTSYQGHCPFCSRSATCSLCQSNTFVVFLLTCRIGIAKAPVFPDPVCASPMTSLPVALNKMVIIATSFKYSKVTFLWQGTMP